MLDAGHGGRDPGAVYNGRQEKIDTLSLTLAIGQILQERGNRCSLYTHDRYLRVALSKGNGSK